MNHIFENYQADWSILFENERLIDEDFAIKIIETGYQFTFKNFLNAIRDLQESLIELMISKNSIDYEFDNKYRNVQYS